MSKKTKIHTPNPLRTAKKAAQLSRRNSESSLTHSNTNRPFFGTGVEIELTALQYLLTSAIGTLHTDTPTCGIECVTVLPGGIAAQTIKKEDQLVRRVALQGVQPVDQYNLAAAISWVLVQEGETRYAQAIVDEQTPTLHALLGEKPSIELTYPSDFSWWVSDSNSLDQSGRQAMENASSCIQPIIDQGALSETKSRYWVVNCDNKNQIRWLIAQPEDDLINAMSISYADGDFRENKSFRLAGTARLSGLAVIVIDCEAEICEAETTVEKIQHFLQNCDKKIALNLIKYPTLDSLTPSLLRARDTLRSRQITL